MSAELHTDFHPGQKVSADTQRIHAEVGPDCTARRRSRDLQTIPAGGAQTTPEGAIQVTPPAEDGPLPPVVDPLLFVHATAHADLEQQRIASEQRLRILTTTEPDEDGVMRGFGLTEDHPDVARLRGLADALRTIEHDAELNLKRALRRCAIHPWVKAQNGLGEKQVARLLGAIGDPYWNLTDDQPRTVSQLWAYSGLHVLSDPGRLHGDTPDERAGVAARRKKGVKANWSTDAKTRAYLCATSCIKQAKSPYRAVYLARREHTAVSHPEWTPGHSHSDGLRIASKAILRDLWREARRLHGCADLDGQA